MITQPTRGLRPVPDWRRAITLTDVEFDVCWEGLNLGDVPPVPELRSPGRDADERRRVRSEVLAGLRQRGLADRHELANPLVGALRVLASAEYELDIRLGRPAGHTLGLGAAEGMVGLAAVAGALGVVVAQHGERIRMLVLDRIDVLPTLIALAAPLTPGAAHPVAVAASVFDEALAAAWTDPAGFADELGRRGVSRAEANAAARIFRDVRTVGQLGASGRVGPTRHRASWVVGFHETPLGHFRQLRRPDPRSGAVTVTLAPIDVARLTAYATELVDQVTRRAP